MQEVVLCGPVCDYFVSISAINCNLD